MYKCPKCDYQNENPGTCPNDNEVLQEVVETPGASETPESPAPEQPVQEPGAETTGEEENRESEPEDPISQ